MYQAFNVQGDPNQNCPILSATTLKLCISDHVLVKQEAVIRAILIWGTWNRNIFLIFSIFGQELCLNGSNMDFNQPGFKLIARKRPTYFLHLLEEFPNIIYTDIDTIWLKDPRPFLAGDYNFWGQIDGILDGDPYSR